MKTRLHACAVLALLVCSQLVTAAVEPDASALEQRQIVRVPLDCLSDEPHDAFCPCAVEAEGAIMYLTEDQIAELDVPFERLGSLADQFRRNLPVKTMATVGVPSMSRALGLPVHRGGSRELPPDVVNLTYDRYHTYQEGQDLITNLANNYPQICKKVGIGFTVDFRPIFALKVTDLPDVEEPGEQSSLFCGVHHAREWATHEMMLYLCEYLVTRYDTDLAVKHIVDNSVIWLVPVVNADGFVYSWEVQRMWRKNRRDNGNGTFGVDLNRNYDYKWGPGYGGSSGNPGSSTYRGTAPASEPETQAIQNLLAQEKPAIAVSYHTYSQLLLFPWGYTWETTAESYASMRAIGKKYEKSVYAVHGTDYVSGPSQYTIYTTNGDFTDYAYGAQGIMAFTPEMRPASSAEGGFLLPEDQILPNNQESLPAALWIMRNVADTSFLPLPDAANFFTAGANRFSLPLSPINQKPENALGMDEPAQAALTTWIDNFPTINHPAPYEGAYPADFEGVGSGSGYFFELDAGTTPWAQSFTGYLSLPYIFEDGTAVMLENYQPGENYIGIPSAEPVRMSRIRIFKRYVEATGNNFGNREIVVEERTALEDLADPDPWIDWSWSHTRANGEIIRSHPQGEDGADTFVHPFLVYEFTSHKPSWQFNTTSPDVGVYLLRFPGPLKGDADDNGVVDLLDLASLYGCLTGPVQGPLSDPCSLFDFDRDFDVDAADAAVFQVGFGGQE